MCRPRRPDQLSRRWGRPLQACGHLIQPSHQNEPRARVVVKMFADWYGPRCSGTGGTERARTDEDLALGAFDPDIPAAIRDGMGRDHRVAHTEEDQGDRRAVAGLSRELDSVLLSR